MTVNGFAVKLAAATGDKGWTVSNTGKATAVGLAGLVKANSLLGPACSAVGCGAAR